jgi:hypothetical protein
VEFIEIAAENMGVRAKLKGRRIFLSAAIHRMLACGYPNLRIIDTEIRRKIDKKFQTAFFDSIQIDKS